MNALFIPVSSASGSGEFYRSWFLADAISNRWPNVICTFLVSREFQVPAGFEHQVVLTDRSPTFHTKEVKAAIDELDPVVTFFDSAGATAQLRHASRNGPVVFVSSRPKKRRKALRFKWVRLITEHWSLRPDPTEVSVAVSKLQRVALKLWPQHKLVDCDMLHALPDVDAAERWLSEQSQRSPSDELIVVCSGGGAGEFNGTPIARIFADAADRVSAAVTGKNVFVVYIAGPLAEPGIEASRPAVTVRQLPAATLLGLFARARLVVVGGGSVLPQAISLCSSVIAAPAGGKDQSARVDQCDGVGWAVGVATDATIMSDAAIAVLNSDSPVSRAVPERVLVNALPNLLTRCEQWFGATHSSNNGGK